MGQNIGFRHLSKQKMSKPYTRVHVSTYTDEMKPFCRDSFGPSGFIKGNLFPWKCQGMFGEIWWFRDHAHAMLFALRFGGELYEKKDHDRHLFSRVK